MNLYLALYAGKKLEITASSSFKAQEAAVQLLKIPKSKRGLLSIILVEIAGEPIVHDGASL